MSQVLTEEVGIEIPEPFLSLFEPKRYKARYGGRGSAKSHSFAKTALCLGYDKPLRILCGREVQRSIKDSVKLLLDDQIGVLGLEDHYTSLQNEIRGRNGTTLCCLLDLAHCR
jgi:phage terminase large subunit